MTQKERLGMVAPCGIDCGICELVKCADNPQMMEALVAHRIPREKLPCAGCRGMKGKCPVIPGTCETWRCVTEKKVEFCHQCADFPCSRLSPASDRANVLPHNMKVFNLCAIRRLGVEGFVGQSAVLMQTYYRGKIEVGKGPRLPS
ncbi:MAG TPA: DUF3795 domain-containing protein [Spirochaetia bacterium]|nr:DUF3795 domain-containing protein [Spirochaetia bacterium]